VVVVVASSAVAGWVPATTAGAAVSAMPGLGFRQGEEGKFCWFGGFLDLLGAFCFSGSFDFFF